MIDDLYRRCSAYVVASVGLGDAISRTPTWRGAFGNKHHTTVISAVQNKRG